MAAVWIARVNRWAERLFDIKGGPSVTDIDPTAHVSLEFMVGNEERFSQGWNRYHMVATQAAVAGQFAAVRLANPTQSGVVGVIEYLTAQSGTTDQPSLFILALAPSLGSAVTSFRADARQQPLATFQGSKGTAAAQAGNLCLQAGIAPSGVPYQFVLTEHQEIVMASGDSVTIWSNVVNQAITVAWTWRERATQNSEYN